MAAAMKTLLGVAQWRWTPFFAIVGGTIVYVLLMALIVPTEIGSSKSSKARGVSVIKDESPPITANMGGTSRAFPSRPPTLSRPSQPTPTLPAMAPPPPPMERPDPIPPPAREVLPDPPPPPPMPPPHEAEEEVEEEEEEEEQGAAPSPRPHRAIAGALRMLPQAGRPPQVAPPAPQGEDEPEPDEPDVDE